MVIFETSPSSSKTDSKYIPYCVFDVGGFIGSSCREVSHLSPHNIFSLGDTQDFVGNYVLLSFQQNWFHPVWSSDAQVIAVLVSAIFRFFLPSGCTASAAGSTATALLVAVVPLAVPAWYRQTPCHLAVLSNLVPCSLPVVPPASPVVPPPRVKRSFSKQSAATPCGLIAPQRDYRQRQR